MLISFFRLLEKRADEWDGPLSLYDMMDLEDEKLFAFYLFDETEIQMSRKEIQNQKLICGIILVDNYEEALNSTEEVRRSLLSALVERKITKYMQNYDAIVNKMEKDKYMFVIRQKYLPGT